MTSQIQYHLLGESHFRALRISGTIIITLYIYTISIISHPLLLSNQETMQPLEQSMSIDTPRDAYAQINPLYKGEKLQITLAEGPLEDRTCTDMLCCLLFLAALAGFGAVAAVGFINGDPNYLMEPFDSTGQQCGFGTNSGYPYVYYNANNYSQFCCINQCPGQNSVTGSKCVYGGSQKNCSDFGDYQTTTQIDICYPSNSQEAALIDIGVGIMEMMISDLQLVWPIQLSIVGISLILSIILLILVRRIGGCLIWGVLTLYFLGLTAFGFVAFFMSSTLATKSGINNPETFKILAYISWSVDAISLFIFLCTFKKLRIAVTVIKAAADFTAKNCYVVMVPIFMFAFAVGFLAFWIINSVYLYSTGEPKPCGSSPYSCVQWNNNIRGLLVYNFFILFWVCQFFISLSQYIVASTAALWYYSHVYEKHNVRPLMRSFGRAFFYHIGSIAFGALVLAIVIILQVFMGIFHWIMKSSTQNKPQNGCMKCCASCSMCCISCFERFLRFLTRNSFILMAITGQNFCKSSHHAFYLAIRIVETYAITNGVCHLIMIFTKLLITAACTVMGFYMITGIEMFADNLFEPILPCVIFAVISYVVSSLFMDVLGISADTLLYCYSIQLDLHGGSVKSCPPGLMEFIQQYR